MSSLAVLETERDTPGANITPTGRIITASLASWVTERANNDNQNVEDTTHTKLAELEALILEMREEMRVK